ncbi:MULTISPECIES: competence protein ComK [unclassified Oceanobacillus]|uniref:competence protein ComK n=1 Tax=unclassified Oceanobacillus TaxID=2630292 RepID=UPI00300E578B
MDKILLNYTITQNDNALLPGRSTHYDTIVLTSEGKHYVKKPPFDIIKESASKTFLTYEGSTYLIREKLGFKYKLPLPINTALGIYAFPTMSPSHPDCIWLFYHRIKSIEDISEESVLYKSKVHFVDGTSLSLTTSCYSLDKQMKRTQQCIDKFDAGQALSY